MNEEPGTMVEWPSASFFGGIMPLWFVLNDVWAVAFKKTRKID